MMGYDNLEVDTPLYRDLYICTKFLHCTHEEFLNRPRLEKDKLRIFLDVKMMKRKDEIDEIEADRAENKMLKNAPEVAKR